MMGTVCSKHVESYNRNKHIEKNFCIMLVIYQQLNKLIKLSERQAHYFDYNVLSK